MEEKELVYTTIEEESKDEAYTDYENLLYNRDYLLKQNTKLQSQIDEVKEWLNSEINKCLDDNNISNRAMPNVRFWKLDDFRKCLSKLEEVGK